MDLLTVKHVSKQYVGHKALDDVSLTIPRGSVYGLLGPNGAGKTTAFNCVTGIYQPTYGSVSFQGEVILADTPQGKTRRLYGGDVTPDPSLKPVHKTPDQVTKLGIARTFQNIRLFGNLTVFDNVLIAKHMRAKQNVFSAVLRLNHAEEKRMREESLELLHMQGLAHLKNEIASSLPYGLQRRLEIARALATGPDLLLLDEPFSALDYQTRLSVCDDISSIIRNAQKTAILITHDLSEAISLADRIIILTGRPASVRRELPIHLTKTDNSPLAARSAPEFHHYFNLLWKELSHEN